MVGLQPWSTLSLAYCCYLVWSLIWLKGPAQTHTYYPPLGFAIKSSGSVYTGSEEWGRGSMNPRPVALQIYRESRVVGSPSNIQVRRTSPPVTAAFARAVASPMVIGVPLKIIANN